MTLITVFLTLLLIMDPFGSIPVFLSQLKHLAPGRRRVVIVRELVIALKMIFPGEVSAGGGAEAAVPPPVVKEPLIVPLAIPLVAGPSAMAYVILISTQFPDRRWEWLGGLVMAWAVSVVVLLMADALSKWLGERVITAIERLMGMILTTLAVQMLLDGLRNVKMG